MMCTANAKVYGVFVMLGVPGGYYCSHSHCTAESLRLNLQPDSRWFMHQSSSDIPFRTGLNCSRGIHSSLSGSSWGHRAPAEERGMSSSVDRGLEALLPKSTGDKDEVQQKEPRIMDIQGNLAIAESGDASIGGVTKERLLTETFPLSGDSNCRSIQGLPDWAIRRTEASLPLKLFTLVIIHKDGKVLLGMKKRGFGKGYFNGFGGKVEKGETIDEAASRELQEEAGVTPVDMSKRGVLKFYFDNDPISWEVHIYHVSDIVGDPCETEEMEPRWFAESEIPYDIMWSDDILWYPEFLKGRRFRGSFYFENTTTLVAHSLQVIST